MTILHVYSLQQWFILSKLPCIQSPLYAFFSFDLQFKTWLRFMLCRYSKICYEVLITLLFLAHAFNLVFVMKELTTFLVCFEPQSWRLSVCLTRRVFHKVCVRICFYYLQSLELSLKFSLYMLQRAPNKKNLKIAKKKQLSRILNIERHTKHTSENY